MTDPIAEAARDGRCVWLNAGDGGPQLARLVPDDVSLSYDAARREVTRHASGRADVVGEDIFTVLAAEIAAGMPEDRWFGYFGYAARADLPARADGTLPDAVWMRPSRIEPLELPATTAVFAGGEASVATPEWYRTAFDAVQEHLHAGNSYEVNLTYRASEASDLAPLEVFRRLWAVNPAPYAAYLHHDVPGARAFVAGSSPERYARIDTVGSGTGRVLEAKPIKGTTLRGGTPEEDAAAAELLRTDQRFRSENLMIVDLLRHDLSQVCEVGSVQVPTLMDVESYASVHQLVSTVRGVLRPEIRSLDALRALFPAGSMTGAPKLRTMQIIDEVEETPRGAYAGALGWIAADGRADLGVVIRTLLSDGSGSWTLGTGGGITVQSQADDEYIESRWKAERLRRALRG